VETIAYCQILSCSSEGRWVERSQVEGLKDFASRQVHYELGFSAKKWRYSMASF